MNKRILAVLTIVLAPVSAFAVDGVTLINQSTVMAAGGFPYVISQSGSYKLSGNLAVPPGTDGIDLRAQNITLDLNGFSISGSGTSGAGFGVASGRQSITLKNGVINNFPVGVFFTGTGEITDLKATANGTGIIVIDCNQTSEFFSAAATAACTEGFESSQTGFVISRTSANLNQGDGFEIWNSAVSDSTASGNIGGGFLVVASTLIHNVANQNFFGASSRLQVFPSSFGSNTFIDNSLVNGGVAGLVHDDLIGDFSQGNNVCTNGPC